MSMYKKVDEAYKKLFSKEPDASIEDWKIAEKVLSCWNVPELGEELAIETLFEIINHVECPNTETTHRIIGRAENLISEFIPELAIDNSDAHMDYIAFFENKYYEKKKAKKEHEERIKKELDREKKII